MQFSSRLSARVNKSAMYSNNNVAVVSRINLDYNIQGNLL